MVFVGEVLGKSLVLFYGKATSWLPSWRKARSLKFESAVTKKSIIYAVLPRSTTTSKYSNEQFESQLPGILLLMKMVAASQEQLTQGYSQRRRGYSWTCTYFIWYALWPFVECTRRPAYTVSWYFIWRKLDRFYSRSVWCRTGCYSSTQRHWRKWIACLPKIIFQSPSQES